jgi:protein disulfide-isomerase A1
LVLNNDNFDDAIKNNRLIMVEFYAPWCGHCKKLAPEYEKAATELKGTAPLAKVDADQEQNRPLAQRFGVRGFPTVKFFRDGVPTDYQGERTADAIITYVKKQAQPALRILDSADAVDKLSSEERVVVVGFFDNDQSEEYKKYQQTAESLRDSFTFGAVVGKPDIAKKFEIEGVPTIILFKQFDEKKNVLPAAEFDTHTDFIKKNSIPLIDEIGPHNFNYYAESGLPLGYLFVDLGVAGQKDQYVEIIRPIAQETKGKMNWIYIDWQKYAKHSERLGLSGKTVPALAIESLQDGSHYAFDEKAEIKHSTVHPWVDTFLAGNLEPTIKSEEIPADNSGPVKVVVAKTYDQIVNDPNKDVLVEFYAPWCGHCKALAPTYEELGTDLKGVESVVIAKIDATSNDVSPKLGIRGFPTIKLFPANNKEQPIDYDGDRTKEDFLRFLKDNCSIKFSQEVGSTEKDEL